MDKQTVQTYNSGAEQYASDYEKFSAASKEFIDTLLGLVPNQDNPLVVDLGCGNGRDAEYFSRFTSQYLGIDASEEMIKLAQARNPKLKFLVGDIAASPLPPEIDLVVAFASLLHLNPDELNKLLQNISLNLKPGGIFGATFMEGEGSFNREDDKGTRLYYRHQPEKIKETLGKSFELVSAEPISLPGLIDKWVRVIFKKTI